MITSKADGLEFEGFENGSSVIVRFSDAHRLLWESDIGWCIPLGLYRYRIDEYHDAMHLKDRGIGKALLTFAFATHTQRCQITANDLVDPTDPESAPPNADAFKARASRFAREVYKEVPKELRPFEFFDDPVGQGRTEIAYQLRRWISVFVLVRVKRDCRGVAPHVDWDLFRKPPVAENVPS